MNWSYPATLIERRKPGVVGHWVGSKVIHAMVNSETYCGIRSRVTDGWRFTADFRSIDQITCKKCLRHPWFHATPAHKGDNP